MPKRVGIRSVRKFHIRKLLEPCRIERRGRRWLLTTWVSHSDQVRLAIGRPASRGLNRRIEVSGSGRTLCQATDSLLSNMRASL